MWESILTIAAGTALLVAAFWVVFYGAATWGLVRRHRSSPPAPIGPPIERVAADLRRLRAATERIAPGTSQVRRVAVVAAYDETLVQACHALGLPDVLSGVPAGPDREAARLRVEAMLEEQGLRFTPDQ